MRKVLDKLNEFYKSTVFRRFLWNTLAGFLGVLAVWIADLDWMLAPIAFAILNGVSKEINKRYL